MLNVSYDEVRIKGVVTRKKLQCDMKYLEPLCTYSERVKQGVVLLGLVEQ